MGFKVGDKVRLTGRSWSYDYDPGVEKEERIIRGFEVYPTYPRLGELPYVLDDSGFKAYIFESGRYDYSATLVEPAEDAVSPSYYRFPGGVEVKEISGHLTSFGGQALQYIARSTRLDGNNKGDVIENLQKAIQFLEWEIERVQRND